MNAVLILKKYQSVLLQIHYLLISEHCHGTVTIKNQKQFAGILVMAEIHALIILKIIQATMLLHTDIMKQDSIKYVSRSLTSVDVKLISANKYRLVSPTDAVQTLKEFLLQALMIF